MTIEQITEFVAYAAHIGGSTIVQKWCEKHLAKLEAVPSTEEVEHILDYLVSEDSPTEIEGMTYEQAKSKSEAWTAAQNAEGNKIKETAKDTEVVLDFKDGFKIVKLVGENAYKREGVILSVSRVGSGRITPA